MNSFRQIKESIAKHFNVETILLDCLFDFGSLTWYEKCIQYASARSPDTYPMCSARDTSLPSCMIFLLNIPPLSLSACQLCCIRFPNRYIFWHLEYTQISVVGVCKEEHLLGVLAMLLLNFGVFTVTSLLKFHSWRRNQSDKCLLFI